MNRILKPSPDMNSNPMICAATDGLVLYSNEAGKPLLHEWGMEIGEKLPSSIVDLVQRAISRNSPEKTEVKVGKKVYLIIFHPLPESGCVFISGFDISDRKELEQEHKYSEETLKASEERLHLAQQVAKIGTFEWNIQTGVNNWAPELEAMYGLQPGEFGKTQPAWEQLVHPDDQSKAVSLVEQAIKTGEPVEGEWRVVWPDSSVHWLMGRWQVFRDAAGQPLRMTGVNIDITARKQAEEDLAKKSKLLNLSYDAILIRDAKDRISYWNEGAREIYGYTKEEALGRISHELLRTEFPLPLDMIFEILFRDERWTGELIHTCKDGKRITVVTRWILDRGSQDNFYSILEANNDITELKRVEKTLHKAYEQIKTQSEKLQAQNEELQVQSEELQVQNEELQAQSVELHEANEELAKSEERYRMLFTNMTEGFGLLEVINNNSGRPYDYRYLEINPVFERYLGAKRGQLLGKNMLEIFPNVSPIAIEKYGEVALSGQPIHFEFFSEIANRPLEIYAFVPEKGKIALILRDITKRKEAENKLKDTLDNLDKLVKERTEELQKAYDSLKESESRFRNLFEVISSGVIVYDVIDKGHDFIFKDINPAGESIDNVLRENIIGKSLYDFFPKVSDIGLDAVFRRVWLTGRPEFFPLTLYEDNRIALWVTNHIYRLPTGELVAVFDDITERKKAEEALANIEIARKKEIHHRIKNNLQVISSLLDLQAEQFKNKERIKDSEVLEAFRESQDRVISMALIHEELYKGNGFETLNFSSYIQKLVENLFQTYSVGNNNISLKLDLVENAFFDMDIAVPLGIIVNELVSNSFKHAFIGRNKGEIRIKLNREENMESIKCIDEDCESTSFTLTVSDNGIGIPEDLDSEDLDTLGMQLVTSLVDQLDGEFKLKRDNGTEFVIRFTAADNNNDNAAQELSPQLVDND